MNLDELRKTIDGLDERIIELLNERTRNALKIGEIKKKEGHDIYVPAREKEVMDRVCELNGGPLPGESVRAIYQEIISAALSLEHDVRVAYLGPAATFTHQAARLKFGSSVQFDACETITDVFAAVEGKSADYGVVPVENTTEGAVTHTLDQFFATPLKICAEVYLDITHCLLSTTDRGHIEKIYSKAEVFGQCRRWLHEHMAGVDLIPTSSTARAAEIAAREPGSAALASRLAAELHGVQVLEEGIQDFGGNVTRFLVIGRQYGPATGEDKTSILFSVKHKVGALYEALGTIRKYDLNMTKIESRPSKSKNWEYFFFVDFEGHTADEPVRKALEEIHEHCSMVTVLGSYPNVMEQQ